MPVTHIVPVPVDRQVYLVTKNGVEQEAQILQRRAGEVYVHYVNTDKRLDEWIPERDFKTPTVVASSSAGPSNRMQTRKRKRSSRQRSASFSPESEEPTVEVEEGSGNGNSSAPKEILMTEEDFDIQHHKQITAQRNFDKVHFGDWLIKTWYFSPYPLIENETDDVSVSSSSAAPPTKIPGVSRATIRSHGRTSDLLAGGLGRNHTKGKNAILWVCEMCFKYMADGLSWELHNKSCTRHHPPGKKVYQRGAHTIWEVDGAKDKLYCQNLSLFGKLFLDVKTLFFDCDNFLFYILTDATSKKDFTLGFFSKEKVSYDDYNLACIITLPPYQRKGYGMLMIEFSYELSRRAGKVGTPECPLSDLGLRSYLAYWVGALIRFFRRVLDVFPANVKQFATKTLPDLSSPSEALEANGMPTKKKKRTKGWDGEVSDPEVTGPLGVLDEEFTSRFREYETCRNPNGSVTINVVVRCTLADIARATNLRVEDAAFALHEVGLLARRVQDEGSKEEDDPTEDEDDAMSQDEYRSAKGKRKENDVIVVSREMVEKVALDRKVKVPCMDMSRVLL